GGAPRRLHGGGTAPSLRAPRGARSALTRGLSRRGESVHRPGDRGPAAAPLRVRRRSSRAVADRGLRGGGRARASRAGVGRGAGGGEGVREARVRLDLPARAREAGAREISDAPLGTDEPAAPTTIAAADAPPLRANRDRIERFAPAQLDLVRTHAAAIRRAAA